MIGLIGNAEKLKANASSKNPKTTLTEFSHPPDLGSVESQPGNSANNVKGIAKAEANASIPKIGFSTIPPADSTKYYPLVAQCRKKRPRPRLEP